MSAILEMTLECLSDTLKAVPFLFGAYLLIEWLAHRAGETFKLRLRRLGGLGPVGGSLLGLVPQCGFSVAAANFYADRIVTPGTLVAVFLATSDEALPILLSPRGYHAILPLLGLKFALAVVAGFVVDAGFRRLWVPVWERDSELRHDHRHDHSHDAAPAAHDAHDEHKGHTDHAAHDAHDSHAAHDAHGEHDVHDDHDEHGAHDEHEAHCSHTHCSGGPLRVAVVHTLRVALLIFAITLLLDLCLEWLGEERAAALLMHGSRLQPVAAALFGLIPSCAASVFLADLYLNGSLTFGSVFAGLSTGAGAGVLVLCQACRSKREVALLLTGLFAVGAAAGVFLDALALDPSRAAAAGRGGAEPAAYRRVIERVASLDPVDAASVYAARCDALVYETLLEYDYDARPYALKPCLAAGMPEISADGREYAFVIDTNAAFAADACFGTLPDGSPASRHVAAADFVYSLKRLADAKLATSGYWLLEGRVKGIEAFREASKGPGPTDYSLPVEGLRAPAPDRLEIVLSAPSPVFLWLLAMPYAAAVPHEAVARYGDRFREHPVGTGPYVLSAWRRNHAMRFARNPAWRGWRDPSVAADAAAGLAPFDEILFPVIDDPSTQWLAFLSGALDLQGEVSRDNWDEVVMADGSLNPKLAAKGISMARMPTLEVSYIGINMEDPLLGDNRKLRQALNAAFDSARWADYYRGRAVPADGPVPPEVAGFDPSPLPFGRGADVAARLLAEAGFPGGRDPATGRRLRLTLDVGRTTQDMRESTELLVAFMDRCGIELVPEYHSWPAFLKKVSERRSQLFRIAWVGDYPDAENFLQLFYGPNASPGPNRCNYSNLAFDALFREAMAAPADRRLELYREMQGMVKEDCPWIFMSNATALSLSGPRLARYRPHDFPYGMEKHLRRR